MNPKKVYLLDNGFRMLSLEHSPNRGKALENAVAIELFRRGEECGYFQASHEVDFILTRAGRPVAGVQVCWELDARNEKREISGLLESSAQLGFNELRLLTYDQEQVLRIRRQRIRVTPVWKWMLGIE
jgi:hypothetical protein